MLTNIEGVAGLPARGLTFMTPLLTPSGQHRGRGGCVSTVSPHCLLGCHLPSAPTRLGKSVPLQTPKSRYDGILLYDGNLSCRRKAMSVRDKNPLKALQNYGQSV